jgi:hypothetical protein
VTWGPAANSATTATVAQGIDRNLRNDRRWVEQVTGREINTVLFPRKQFRALKIDDSLNNKASLLSLRGTPE